MGTTGSPPRRTLWPQGPPGAVLTAGLNSEGDTVAQRKKRAGIIFVEEYDYIRVRSHRFRWWERLPQLPQFSRRFLATIITISVLVGLLGGGVLYLTGPLDPFARVATVAQLPAPLAPAAYTRVAVDGAGWAWVAQSSPGLASNPHDQTMLTVVDPGNVIGDPVRARICLGCKGESTPIARIDDIATVPGTAHSLYVAGWTLTTKSAASAPVVVRLDLSRDVSACKGDTSCGTITRLLDTTTQFIMPDQYNDLRPAQLLANLMSIGAEPLLTLTTAPDGHLYCFLSDRGRAGLADKKYNLLGGFQGLLRYDPAEQRWTLPYLGAAGSVGMQQISPTSTVTAIVVDRQDRFLYLADADHHTIMRMDLDDPALGALGHPTGPLVAATAITRIAGQPLANPPIGVDIDQAIPGWQGDGGSALQARLGVVRGLAIDRDGDLLVSDAGNGRIRLITPRDTISTVAGDSAGMDTGGDPAHIGLSGVLGIAVDARNRIFAIQNQPDASATSASNMARLRVLDWGWSSPAGQTYRAQGTHVVTTSDIVAGLPSETMATTRAAIVSDGDCHDGHPNDTICLSSYLIAAGGPNLSQEAPAAPSRAPVASQTVAGSGMTIMAQAPGTPIAVLAVNDGTQLTFALPEPQCCGAITTPAPVSLPSGLHATGIALLMPQTDTQLSVLKSAYILVAATGDVNGADLLIYKASAETCGLEPADQCTRFPGTPTLAATVPLTPAQSAGAVAAALSDDGKHAFALVANPQDDQVSAVDLSGFVTTGTAPIVGATIPVPSPQTIAIRHDGLAAYIGVSDGQIIQLDTTGWLTSGIPLPVPGNAFGATTIGEAGSPITALALSGDDTHLFAAQTTHDATTIIAVNTGEFGTPAPPHVTGTVTAERQLMALALTPGDAQLVALADHGGAGILHVWQTHDITQPDRWLDTPQDLGTTGTTPAPRGLLFVPQDTLAN